MKSYERIRGEAMSAEISVEFDKDTLSEALTAVSAAQVDSDIGVVQLVFPGNNKVIFSSISSSIAVQYEIEARYENPFMLKVPGRQFLDYTKQLPQQKVHIKVEMPHRMHLRCGGSSARIQLIQDSTVNSVHASSSNSILVSNGKSLEKWLGTFKDFISVDDSRFYANGALLWAERHEHGDRICAVSSDALRLASSMLYEQISIQSTSGGRVLISKKAIEEFRRVCAQFPEEEFTVKWSELELSFSVECKNYLMFVKSIAGIYPPYESAFPEKIHSEITMDLKHIQECVKRSLIFADNKTKDIRLCFEGLLLKLETKNEGQREGQEVVEVSGSNDHHFEVNYNGSLLSSVFNAISGSVVTFAWENTVRPVKITGEKIKGLDTFYLLVPNRF